MRAALPVDAKLRAEAVVEIAELALDLVARFAAARADRVAIEQVEARQAVADQHRVLEFPRVIDRDLDAAAAAATAPEPAETAMAPAAAVEAVMAAAIGGAPGAAIVA